MKLAELLPAFHELPRADKVRAVQFLAAELGQTEGNLLSGAELYPRFQPRLMKVEADASHVGWGYCDSVREQVELLENALDAEEEGDGGPATATNQS